MSETTVSITLKNVPTNLHRLLKQQAREHKRSLNQEAILCIERALTGVRDPSTSLMSPPPPASAGALAEPWRSRSEMLEGFLDRDRE